MSRPISSHSFTVHSYVTRIAINQTFRKYECATIENRSGKLTKDGGHCYDSCSYHYPAISIYYKAQLDNVYGILQLR